MLADEVDYVVGVDTHRDEHALAIVVAPAAGSLRNGSVRATARGYSEAVRCAEQHVAGSGIAFEERGDHERRAYQARGSCTRSSRLNTAAA